MPPLPAGPFVHALSSACPELVEGSKGARGARMCTWQPRARLPRARMRATWPGAAQGGVVVRRTSAPKTAKMPGSNVSVGRPFSGHHWRTGLAGTTKLSVIDVAEAARWWNRL